MKKTKKTQKILCPLEIGLKKTISISAVYEN